MVKTKPRYAPQVRKTQEAALPVRLVTASSKRRTRALPPDDLRREVRAWAVGEVRAHLGLAWDELKEQTLRQHLVQDANPEREILNELVAAVRIAVGEARKKIAVLRKDGRWPDRWNAVQFPVVALDDELESVTYPPERARLTRPYPLRDLRQPMPAPDVMIKMLGARHNRDRLVLFLHRFANVLSIEALKAVRAGVPDSALAAVFVLTQPASYFREGGHDDPSRVIARETEAMSKARLRVLPPKRPARPARRSRKGTG